MVRQDILAPCGYVRISTLFYPPNIFYTDYFGIDRCSRLKCAKWVCAASQPTSIFIAAVIVVMLENNVAPISKLYIAVKYLSKFAYSL